MQIFSTKFKEVKVFEPKIFNDERGFFFESFNLKYIQNNISQDLNFVQDNHSKSKKGVIRGLHYQLPPFGQGKLVRVIKGSILDVVVDIRKSSPNFGDWIGVELSSDNKKQLWIPEGFAHGFLALSEGVELLYKTTNYYNSDSERSIKWDDKNINIDWKLNRMVPSVSIKDQKAKKLIDAEIFD